MRLLYLCLGYCLVPLAVLLELGRGLTDRRHWRHLGERFGFGPTLSASSLWVHAVSVGEVQAAATLVRTLHARHPTLPLVLTTATVTGRQRAVDLVGTAATIRYLPYDLPGAMARFLDGVRPRLGLVLETELWPNLYAAARQRGVPMMLASARVSARSVRRYRRLGRLIGDTLTGVYVAAQTAADAERFVALGADSARTEAMGNLKFDYQPPADIGARGAALRALLGAGRPLWVAGSTHEGEEAQVLEAHAALRRRRADALLVLAPRHPPRFESVATLLRRRGVPAVTRSSGAAVTATTEVLLLDTLGELVAFYAACDVAYVGGSLVPIGGHNLLEPAALARPVLAGPHTFNDPAVARLLQASGALTVVEAPAALATAVERWLADPAMARAAGEAGRGAVVANQGALARLLERVERFL